MTSLQFVLWNDLVEMMIVSIVPFNRSKLQAFPAVNSRLLTSRVISRVNLMERIVYKYWQHSAADRKEHITGINVLTAGNVSRDNSYRHVNNPQGGLLFCNLIISCLNELIDQRSV